MLSLLHNNNGGKLWRYVDYDCLAIFVVKNKFKGAIFGLSLKFNIFMFIFVVLPFVQMIINKQLSQKINSQIIKLRVKFNVVPPELNFERHTIASHKKFVIVNFLFNLVIYLLLFFFC